MADADSAYRKVVGIDEYSPIAERVRDALRAMAQKTFHDKVPGVPPPDAVMHRLGAMERFEKMSRAEVQRIAFEIATLGQKRLNVNDPDQKYGLKSLSGGYSGLRPPPRAPSRATVLAPDGSSDARLARASGSAQSDGGCVMHALADVRGGDLPSDQ